MTPTFRSETSTDRARSRIPQGLLILAVVAPLMTSTVALAKPAAASTPASVATSQQNESRQVSVALDRLRNDGMLDQSTAKRPDVSLMPASTFGRSLFNGVAFAGGQVILSQILSAMGYDPDRDFSQALKEINDSIAALNEDVRRISEQVERVLEGQDRTHFYNSYTQAGIAAANLDTAMRSVGAWIEKDLQPSESNLSDMQTVITTSIGQLDFLLTNPTTGTVPLMMKAAEPSGVSDLKAYWDQVDTVRDDYRAVLAQGLATLSAMERWDATGTIAADLETFTPRAKQTVGQMYEFGVAVDADRVHVRGIDAILLAKGTKPVSGESGARDIGNRGEAEPLLQALAANFRSGDHGGQTLESYLKANGVPTSINYLDTYTVEPRNNRWASLNTVGRISGNTYQAVERQFGNTYSPLDPNGHNSAMAQAHVQRQSDGPGATRVSVSLNAGGRAADLTPGVVEQAAFGLE